MDNMDKLLLEASGSGDIDNVITLLNTNANIEAVNEENNTSLHIASRNGHLNVVLELLNRNANIKAKTKKENTQVSYIPAPFLKKIGRQALIKKKCKLVVLAIDSKLAIGSKIKESENTDLVILFGIDSVEAR